MNLISSQEIIQRAIAEYKPYAIISMLSGGKDSLCAYYVARYLNIPIDFIMHGVTGTGIRETTEFVRSFAEQENVPYLEANAGKNYENYILKNGFMGLGNKAHGFAYHICKHQVFLATLSKSIRHRKRNRNILLITGARITESLNRSKKIQDDIRPDISVKANVWVNIIHNWTREDRDDFLNFVNATINPVTQVLCRSGECMCGTMQSIEQRIETAFFYPEWGKWLLDLEHAAQERGHVTRWGEHLPGQHKYPTSYQKMGLDPDNLPMCVSCKVNYNKLGEQDV